MLWPYSGGLLIGNNVYIGEGTRIWSGEKIEIGSNVLISHNVNIMDSNSHEIDPFKRAENFCIMIDSGHPKEKGDVKTSPVKILDYAWIGFGSSILKGVTIGEDAIVSANSVVLSDVEDNTIVAGNPAKLVRKINQ